MKKLPIGIQTFSELIDGNYYYVDKTPLIAELIASGKYYFLARPRRFGKSLLVSTLKSVFAGEKALFDRLYLQDQWDWSVSYPVIHISFGGGVVSSAAMLDERFRAILDETAELYRVELQHDDLANRFSELIKRLADRFQQRVVVLVDEYDKPILDNIEHAERAVSIREGLRNIYSVIKDRDAYLKFALLTGVSKFSKVSLFSGLNNLQDISLDCRYAALCGYTLAEIKSVFNERLQGVDFSQLAEWYNGYNFLGEKVYNPFDVLLYLEQRLFKNYWFESGSPGFLIKLVRERQYSVPDLENVVVDDAMLTGFDIDDITLENVLFQTGYLTIERVEELGGECFYHLTYPNREVKASLNSHLLRDLMHAQAGLVTRQQMRIYNAFEQADPEQLRQALTALFASISNDWYRQNQLAHYEGYYASIVYCCLAALGLTVTAEDVTNKGRIDLTVKLAEKVFIIEFKVLEGKGEAGRALAQIKARKYWQKYASGEFRVMLIGIEFDKTERNIVRFDWEAV
ncbi:ATP-binding protein [Methylomarinum vadi]|uniref:ATP-binding protein n=1 Tax=Methylomarinum vadi TaxID=438855 RepID=UPI0004DF5F92|nr:ATP-binding protein [Methylomarinum vadi]